MGEDNQQDLAENGWNADPAWVRYITSPRMESHITAIGKKLVTDRDMREDCAQEARIELMKTFPEHVHEYERYRYGTVSEERWQAVLDAYCRQVIRFTMLSTLTSRKKGPWYQNRTQMEGGKVKHTQARFVRMDRMIDGNQCQIDEVGNLHWSGKRASKSDFPTHLGHVAHAGEDRE